MPKTMTQSLSCLRLKLRVLRMSFLYLCFFIFSFLCRLTLIACHVILRFSSTAFHVSCLVRIRSRKGWRGAGKGSVFVGSSSSEDRTVDMEGSSKAWAVSSMGTGGGGGTKGWKFFASSSMLTKMGWPSRWIGSPDAWTACFASACRFASLEESGSDWPTTLSRVWTADDSVYRTSVERGLFAWRGLNIEEKALDVEVDGTGETTEMGRYSEKKDAICTSVHRQ